MIEALAGAMFTRCSLERASDNADLWSRASNASSRCLLVPKRRGHRPLRRDFQGPGLVPFALGPDQHVGIGFQRQGIGMPLRRDQHLGVGEIRKNNWTPRLHGAGAQTLPEGDQSLQSMPIDPGVPFHATQLFRRPSDLEYERCTAELVPDSQTLQLGEVGKEPNPHTASRLVADRADQVHGAEVIAVELFIIGTSLLAHIYGPTDRYHLHEIRK